MASKVIDRHVGIPEQPRKGAVRRTGARCCVGACSHSSRKSLLGWRKLLLTLISSGLSVSVCEAVLFSLFCATLKDVSRVE